MVAPVPPADRAPPAEGVNLRYAVHPDFPASRSAGSMVKLTPVTLSPMLPALKATDGPVSKDVSKVTLPETGNALNLTPVMVSATLPLILEVPPENTRASGDVRVLDGAKADAGIMALAVEPLFSQRTKRTIPQQP